MRITIQSRPSIPALIALCITGLLILSACASPPAPAADTAPAVSSDTSEVAGKVSFMVFGDPAELKAFQGLVAAFEEKFPSVDVELIHIPSQSDYRKRLSADFAAGIPSDVVLLNYRRFGPFAAKGALEPIGPYLQASEVISQTDFYPEPMAPYNWQGQQWCLPQNLSSLVVYYNKDLFDAAGLAYPDPDWTWSDFLATAQALTKDTDGDGTIDQYGLGTETTFLRLAPFVWQNGGEIVDDPVNPSRLTLDSPAAVEAFTWFTDLQNKHHVVPSAVEEQAEDSESRFMNGRTAMYFNSRRVVPTFREITGFDWDVAALPQQSQKANVLHADAYCMAKATKDKDAAWKFIEFANSVEGQTIVAASGRTVPSLKSVAESPAFLEPNAKPANSQVWLDVVPFTRPMPVTANWIDVEEIVDSEFDRAYYGSASIDEAIRAAITRSADLLAEQ